MPAKKTSPPKPPKPPNEPDSAQTGGNIAADRLCALTGLTDRRHRQLATAGFFPPPIKGQYQAGKTIAGLFTHFRQLLAKKDETLRKEQEGYTRAKRQLAEEELAQARGLYVLKADIGPALRNISLHQRAVLQRKFEQEISPNLAGLTTLEILGRIKPAVDEVCAIFREGTKEWLSAPPEAKESAEGGMKNAEMNPKNSVIVKPRRRGINTAPPLRKTPGTRQSAKCHPTVAGQAA